MKGVLPKDMRKQLALLSSALGALETIVQVADNAQAVGIPLNKEGQKSLATAKALLGLDGGADGQHTRDEVPGQTQSES